MSLKRFKAMLLTLIALALLGAGPAVASIYATTQISTLGGAYLGLFPKINGKGEVAWMGNYYDSPGLYLYSNGQVKQLTSNPDIQDFDINDLGEVVWSGMISSPYVGYDIYLYKNGVTTPITTDGNNNFDPSFNDKGDFVWNSYNGDKAYIRLCTAAGSVSTIWTCPSLSMFNTNYVFPVINNLGQVAWRNYANYSLDENIYLYSGGIATIVHTSSSFTALVGYTEPLHSLNNNGDLVFSGSDGIWLKKSGAAAQQIGPVNPYCRPRINDSGVVAYAGDSAAHNTAIYLYDGSAPHKITDDGIYPQINNQGQVIWADTQGINLYDKNFSGLVVPYSNGETLHPSLNSHGLVAWQGTYSGDGIFLSRPLNSLPGLQLLLLQ